MNTKSSKSKALDLIRDSATLCLQKEDTWNQEPSLVNPSTTLFLLEEIDRLNLTIKSLSNEVNEYHVGYTHGFEDALLTRRIGAERAFAWAITDQSRTWVRFTVEKPTQIPRDQKVHALFTQK